MLRGSVFSLKNNYMKNMFDKRTIHIIMYDGREQDRKLCLLDIAKMKQTCKKYWEDSSGLTLDYRDHINNR